MNYRILSLDGGGPWAVIEVLALIDLYGEAATGHDVLAKFDLVAANSGGAIVLGGLVENLTLGAIRNMLQDPALVGTIFVPTAKILNDVAETLLGIGPKWSAQAKLRGLERLMPSMGARPMSGITAGLHGPAGEDVRLVIIGFDYDTNRAHFFRSNPHVGPIWGEGDATEYSIAEAIHASSNAPVNYFDGPAVFPDQPGRYWDGGVTGANNPALVATVEAVASGRSLADIVVLSLGTGTVTLPDPADPRNPTLYERKPASTGLVADIGKIASAILDDPPDAATYVTYAMLQSVQPAPAKGAPVEPRIVRMSPLIAPVRNGGAWRPPAGITPSQFKELLELPMDAVKDEQLKEIAAFGELWIKDVVRNQPIRMKLSDLTPELPYPTYSEAKWAWLAL